MQIQRAWPHFVACVILASSLSACSDDDSKINFPSAQLTFHALNAECYKRYDAGQNEIQKSSAFNECNSQRKQFAAGNKVLDWVGTIKSIRTNQGGSEVVVNIASSAGGFDIAYATPGVGVQAIDLFTADIIHPTSPIYQKLATMKEGDMVRFDAVLLPSTERGIDEESLTEEGSMQDPAFTIRLDDIRPYKDAASNAQSTAAATTSSPPKTATVDAPTSVAAASPVAETTDSQRTAPAASVVPDVPKGESWWLTERYPPIDTTIESIPVSLVNRNWVKASVLSERKLSAEAKRYFAWMRTQADFGDIRSSTFLIDGDFNKDGVKDRAIVGTYQGKSGQLGRFLLILTQNETGWNVAHLETTPGNPGFSVLYMSGGSIVWTSCFECDDGVVLEWKNNRYELVSPKGEDE